MHKCFPFFPQDGQSWDIFPATQGGQKESAIVCQEPWLIPVLVFHPFLLRCSRPLLLLSGSHSAIKYSLKLLFQELPSERTRLSHVDIMGFYWCFLFVCLFLPNGVIESTLSSQPLTPPHPAFHCECLCPVILWDGSWGYLSPFFGYSLSFLGDSEEPWLPLLQPQQAPGWRLPSAPGSWSAALAPCFCPLTLTWLCLMFPICIFNFLLSFLFVHFILLYLWIWKV